MLRKQRGRAGSSLLELEAAEYFRLDLDQLDLSRARQRQVPDLRRVSRQSSGVGDSSEGPVTSHTITMSSRARTNSGQTGGVSREHPGVSPRDGRCESNRKQSSSNNKSQTGSVPKRKAVKASQQLSVSSRDAGHGRSGSSKRAGGSTGRCSAPCISPGPRRGVQSSAQRQQDQQPSILLSSSTASTNSLPSITSSPSVSPSLVCPHLSLDDILDCRQDSSGSPHTIGLCPKCRLDPPPNIHSPLSPHFKPNSRSSSACGSSRALKSMNTSTERVRRGYSDQHTSYCMIRQTRTQSHQQAAQPSLPAMVRHQSDFSRLRDDSLDFCLEPKEIRRMQMSPTMRNSVDFIRRNSIESGRVVRVYKNGEPYEKPLRICILRGEFANLTHLLDHVNSRLLVPLGARYLFHLDGQLVYSVHELKHNHAYVVSGTRSYDYRTSEVLREQQRREQANRSAQERTSAGQHLMVSPVRKLSGSQLVFGEESRSAGQTKPKVAAAIEEDTSTSSASRADQDRWADEQSSGRVQAKPAPATRKSRPPPYCPNQARPPKGLSPAKSKLNLDGVVGPTTGTVAPDAIDESQSSAASSEKQIVIMRAKSELSAIPSKKLKKNVTFKDTGRGSSPAISDLSSSGTELGTIGRRTVSTSTLNDSAPSENVGANGSESSTSISLKKELCTSEIGIQVSDSIDGFLIDLPVALPSKGDDSSLVDKPANRSRVNQRPKGPSQAVTPARSSLKKPRQIVTITERQLSHEEMHELNDLSKGDHHDRREAAGEPSEEEKAEERPSEDAPPVEPEVVPDRSDTIVIGSNPGVSKVAESILNSGRLVTSAVIVSEPAGAAEETGHWQYPGGDAASSTPAERPVSQIGPNEAVRARVTTPTPSLSNGGDNNSLTLSYDTVAPTGASGAPEAVMQSPRRVGQGPSGQLPPKSRIEVKGVLCDGLDAPKRNFRLVWVNGFAINDIYPDNSVDVQRLAESEAGNRARVEAPQSPSASRLTPNRGAGAPQQPQVSEFKPSERYHNWICHSRKHDELVYPAGALVVLWCRWTNEQRYYARHTTNVSCLTLAAMDSDLAASAQSYDPVDRRSLDGGSLVHLWSLTSLDLLRVIDNDQFRSKLIFSVRLKGSSAAGCQLSVAARDDKQLFLLECSVQQTATGAAETMNDAETGKDQAIERKNSKTTGRQPITGNAGVLAMRASKILPSNQLPLFLLRVPRPSNQVGPTAGKQQQPAEPLLSFGRRHFNMWLADAKQRKLRLMQMEHRCPRLSELLAKANCLCRLSPGEFLLGDGEGSIALLMMSCKFGQAGPAARVSTGLKRAPQAKVAGPGGDAQPEARYSIEIIELVEQASKRPDLDSSISCITRISGSLFMSGDASCTVRFWRISRRRSSNSAEVDLATGGISCVQLSSISLPPDLGYICAILLARYDLKESVVEFYVVSTSNSILFGSVKLPAAATAGRRARQTGSDSARQQPADLLANSSLSVVYEGHETSATGLVADTGAQAGQLYFTCSLDCRICKWNGRQLIWKSMLPSACVSLAVHPRGSVLAVGSIDGTVYILDKTSGLLVSYFPLTPVRINCLAYSRDGSLLAAGCANGSIFMLPVAEGGLKYRKVSIFQSPGAVVSLQFSLDNRYMLTSVSHGSYQELILWDLPNFRYMRDDVKLAADRIQWYDSICSGSEDVRAIWENAHLLSSQEDAASRSAGRRAAIKPPQPSLGRNRKADQFVVNLSCHRLVEDSQRARAGQTAESYVIASDTRGFLRLFRYPAYDIQQGFYATRICSSAVNCCRFLDSASRAGSAGNSFVSTSLDGSICLWLID